MNKRLYKPPLDVELAMRVEALDSEAREFFEERAGIREHDALQSKAEAEAGAWTETLLFLEQRRRDQGG